MRYSGTQVVFQEIPEELSLAIHVTGCPQRCVGCHSSLYWNPEIGEDLNPIEFNRLIDKYMGYVSCVLFLGGEWNLPDLLLLAEISKSKGLKVALYTGLEWDDVPDDLKRILDYLKYGPFISHLGPLNSPNTNQKLINLKTSENLNKYFLRSENYGQTK